MNFTSEELLKMGMKIGKNVQIHRSVVLVNPEVIEIGSNVRIDAHSIITAKQPIKIGNFIHVGAAVHIFGTAGVELHDYCGISSRVSIFTTTDDYNGGYLSNPTIPEMFKKSRAEKVTVEKHVLIGCGSVIMPGVTLRFGCSIGALTFIRKTVPSGLIVAGPKMEKVGNRNLERLETLEAEHREWYEKQV